MKKVIILFVLLLSLGFVFAANGWGDTNTGNDGDDDVEDDIPAGEDVVPAALDIIDYSDAETRYTQNFYIALGVAGVGILIALLFIYLFLRSPKNRWKKKPVRNVSVVKKANSKVVKG